MCFNMQVGNKLEVFQKLFWELFLLTHKNSEQQFSDVNYTYFILYTLKMS